MVTNISVTVFGPIATICKALQWRCRYTDKDSTVNEFSLSRTAEDDELERNVRKNANTICVFVIDNLLYTPTHGKNACLQPRKRLEIMSGKRSSWAIKWWKEKRWKYLRRIDDGTEVVYLEHTKVWNATKPEGGHQLIELKHMHKEALPPEEMARFKKN